MAQCGWCKAKNLSRVQDNGDGKVLETHHSPNSRRICNGQATAPGYNRREKR